MSDEMNSEKAPDMMSRSKDLALRVIRLSAALPRTFEARIIRAQLVRSGTSVGAQLRESKRSRSRAEMISKTESALQELEETMYWLELLCDSGMMKKERLQELMKAADELTAILVSGVRTLKARNADGRSSK